MKFDAMNILFIFDIALVPAPFKREIDHYVCRGKKTAMKKYLGVAQHKLVPNSSSNGTDLPQCVLDQYYLVIGKHCQNQSQEVEAEAYNGDEGLVKWRRIPGNVLCLCEFFMNESRFTLHGCSMMHLAVGRMLYPWVKYAYTSVPSPSQRSTLQSI